MRCGIGPKEGSGTGWSSSHVHSTALVIDRSHMEEGRSGRGGNRESSGGSRRRRRVGTKRERERGMGDVKRWENRLRKFYSYTSGMWNPRVNVSPSSSSSSSSVAAAAAAVAAEVVMAGKARSREVSESVSGSMSTWSGFGRTPSRFFLFMDFDFGLLAGELKREREIEMMIKIQIEMDKGWIRRRIRIG